MSQNNNNSEQNAKAVNLHDCNEETEGAMFLDPDVSHSASATAAAAAVATPSPSLMAAAAAVATPSPSSMVAAVETPPPSSMAAANVATAAVATPSPSWMAAAKVATAAVVTPSPSSMGAANFAAAAVPTPTPYTSSMGAAKVATAAVVTPSPSSMGAANFAAAAVPTPTPYPSSMGAANVAGADSTKIVDIDAAVVLVASNVTSGANPCTSSEDCPICLQTCMYPARLPCSHVFCFLCAKGAALRYGSCSLCRSQVPAAFLKQPQMVNGILDICDTRAMPDGYQWYYKGRNGWWQYDYRSAEDIEESYQKGDQSCTVLIAGLNFIIDLKNLLQQREQNYECCRDIKRDLATIPKQGVAGLRIVGTQVFCDDPIILFERREAHIPYTPHIIPGTENWSSRNYFIDIMNSFHRRINRLVEFQRETENARNNGVPSIDAVDSESDSGEPQN